MTRFRMDVAWSFVVFNCLFIARLMQLQLTFHSRFQLQLNFHAKGSYDYDDLHLSVFTVFFFHHITVWYSVSVHIILNFKSELLNKIHLNLNLEPV